MSDTQTREFSGRLRRIEKIHRRGGGFEADGTLGQSHYTRLRVRSQRRPLLRRAIAIVLVIEALKGGLLAVLGEQAYAAKIVALGEGGIVDQIGGFIMAADPLSRTIAQIVQPILG